MGLRSSSMLQPEELVSFKKLPTTVTFDNIEIPERPENRRPTNVKWLIALGVFLLVLLPFMIYTFCYSDITRVTVGYDKCGNTCGKKNSEWEGIPCSGKDFTNKPFLQYQDEDYTKPIDFIENELKIDFRDRECVQTCKSGYIGIFGRCIRGNRSYEPPGQKINDVDFSFYFASVKWQLVISCLLTILVSMGMLFLFRYAMAFVVWGILIGCLLEMFVLVCLMWYFYTSVETDQQDGKKGLLIIAIIFSVFAVALTIVLIWCRKKVRLVIMLLSEATKAVFDMPGLIAIPVICVVCILILASLFGLTTTIMSSAGILHKVREDIYTYSESPVMVFSMAYNLVAFLWVLQFFTGIQYMVIAGAVTKWYFSREKNYLGRPILNAISTTFRFHLGSIALGSLLITLMQIIKAIILSFIKNEKIKICIESFINAIEDLFKFLSKNAYIVTAMHGQAFLRSGKRAAKLLIQNLGDVIAVNYIGDFVLGMAKLIVVIVSVLVAMGVFATAPQSVGDSHLISYGVVGVCALLVVLVTFGVFETTIDTLFICYCEDHVLNDGMAKPYFMSRNLAEFVQESKQVYGKK